MHLGHLWTRPRAAGHCLALALCATAQIAQAADPCAALFKQERPVVSVSGPAAALAELTRLGDEEPEPDGPNDQEALRLLCRTRADCPTTPFGVQVPSNGLSSLGLLVPGDPMGVVRVAQIFHEYQCSGDAEVQTEAHSGGWVRVYGYVATPRVEGSDDAGRRCDPESSGCMIGCWANKKKPFDWWIHPASKQVLSRRTPKRRAPTVKETPEGPQVGSCPLRMAPAAKGNGER